MRRNPPPQPPAPVATVSKTIPEVFQAHGFFVSHETILKLETYEALLQKWQKAINLVGPLTITETAERHFFDSAQMMRHIPDTNIKMADMGSGAGFPGMVLAILGVREVHLIESDVRKATFLREVSRETKTPVTIHDKRAEDCKIDGIDLFTARALAPLKDLLDHMARLTTKSTCSGLFLKGAQYEDEIAKAKKRWEFVTDIQQSETDPAAKIIRVSRLMPKACGT